MAVVPSTSRGGASPLTTKGDLFGFQAADARIPIGADNAVLTADSAQALGLKWTAAAAAGALTQLFDVTATGGETSLDTGANGVAQTANHLLVIVLSRHNVAETVNSGGLRFNNDSAANYGSERFRVNNATGTAAAFAGETSCGKIISSGTNAANAFGSNAFFIPYYRSGQQKTAIGLIGFIQAVGTVGSMEGGVATGGWSGTAAITRLAYIPSAALIADSRLTIYGLT